MRENRRIGNHINYGIDMSILTMISLITWIIVIIINGSPEIGQTESKLTVIMLLKLLTR